MEGRGGERGWPLFLKQVGELTTMVVTIDVERRVDTLAAAAID